MIGYRIEKYGILASKINGNLDRLSGMYQIFFIHIILYLINSRAFKNDDNFFFDFFMIYKVF